MSEGGGCDLGAQGQAGPRRVPGWPKIRRPRSAAKMLVGDRLRRRRAVGLSSRRSIPGTPSTLRRRRSASASCSASTATGPGAQAAYWYAANSGHPEHSPPACTQPRAYLQAAGPVPAGARGVRAGYPFRARRRGSLVHGLPREPARSLPEPGRRARLLSGGRRIRAPGSRATSRQAPGCSAEVKHQDRSDESSRTNPGQAFRTAASLSRPRSASAMIASISS